MKTLVLFLGIISMPLFAVTYEFEDREGNKSHIFVNEVVQKCDFQTQKYNAGEFNLFGEPLTWEYCPVTGSDLEFAGFFREIRDYSIQVSIGENFRDLQRSEQIAIQFGWPRREPYENDDTFSDGLCLGKDGQVQITKLDETDVSVRSFCIKKI